MQDLLTKAKHYRDQADALREMAERDDNPTSKDALLALADTYDRLCWKSLEAAQRILEDRNSLPAKETSGAMNPGPVRTGARSG